MNLNRPRQRARKLLEECNIESAPVDVAAVARKLGIEVTTQQLDDNISGVLVAGGTATAIGVNQDHHPRRQRFTIAHEVGHYLLHRTTSNIFVDSTLTFYRDSQSSEGTHATEIEANAFAAELLMPEHLLQDMLRTRSVDIYDEIAVQHLASQFDVSEQAMTIRLVSLGLVTI